MSRPLRALVLALLLSTTVLPAAVSARAPTDVDERFTAYFSRCGPGWNGGDSGYTFELGGSLSGSVAWLWSDTLLGTIRDDGTPDGRRVLTGFGIPPFARNTITLQPAGDTPPLDESPDSFVTLTGSDSGDEAVRVPSYLGPSKLHAGFSPLCASPVPPIASLVRPKTGESRNVFWAGDGTVEPDGTLKVVLRRLRQVGPLSVDFRWLRNVVATFVPTESRSLRLVGLSPAPSSTRLGIRWGAAIVHSHGDLYVYGTAPRDKDLLNSLYVARVPDDRLDDEQAWRFWDGHRFVASQSRALSIGFGTDHEFSVLPARHGWALISADGPASLLRSNAIRRWTAPRLTGPFERGPAVYQLAENDPPDWYAYSVHVHPMFRDASGWLVSYSAMGPDYVRDIDGYRPRFVRIKNLTG